MDEELQLRGMRPRTRKTYLYAVRRFAEFHRRRPDQLDREDVRTYLVHLVEERQLSSSSINQSLCALRFLYVEVLRRPEVMEGFRSPKKRSRRLPVVLSRPELARLFKVAGIDLRYQTLWMTIYSAGLRVGEARALHVADIDSEAMQIRVREGKGDHQRLVMLSERLLGQLRRFWQVYRPSNWLFYGPEKDRPLHIRTLQRRFQQDLARADVTRPATLHSLRHSFATHLLEKGTPLPYIQALLGHRSLTSTMIYARVRRTGATNVQSPLEEIPGELVTPLP